MCRLWNSFFNCDQVLMMVRRRTMAATGVSLNSSRSQIYFTNDLPKLNRYPSTVLYVSGNAVESCLRSENYVTIKPLICEVEDTTLLDLIPFLECKCYMS
ncbi:putative FCP1 domain-containing protein [Helianthus annuus]|nr:putative FCP1 domain-containing protein [Helianthus annuus]